MIVDRARIGAVLPAYELGAELGTGAFGLVLAGRHRRLDRHVAIKVLAAGHDGAVTDFAAEARLLAGIDHPHVVRVYDYVETGDLHLIIMELLGGGTLTRRRVGLPQEDACAVGLAVAAALSCAHGQGMLHRDIKTDNMLFDTTGLLKVTDFGIAKIVEGSAATASALVGTPAYMAPEQITGGRLGPATDLYALGIVLYQLLAGVAPFDPKLPVRALWQHHLDTIPTPPVGVPAPVAEVVLRALAKDPAARQPSAHAFALDLAHAAAGAYGPDWTARSSIRLRLDDDVREAAGHSSAPTGPVPPTTRRIPTPPPPPAAAFNKQQPPSHQTGGRDPDPGAGHGAQPPWPRTLTMESPAMPGNGNQTRVPRRRLRWAFATVLLLAAIAAAAISIATFTGDDNSPQAEALQAGAPCPTSPAVPSPANCLSTDTATTSSVSDTDRSSAGSPSPAVPSASSSASSGASGTSGTSGTTSKLWAEANAVLTAIDGVATSVRAETLSYCISVGHGITLSSGQDIAFEKMRSIEVLRSDDQFAPNGKADVVVTLLSGGTARGGIGSGCDFFGTNDLGRFSIYPQRLKRIDFQR
ncbi:serine/threonine-protein kinase [Candidatus Protofrankia californiensis]|uniref:serine/threonine-protein kinase n=1 Tax=Candidatus Protofrankia californiensis TaxID=1839754 RepID=UPI0010411B3A|nr:serine/threonine-protein kinase [Candidatus Protofrankia californiensis]